MRVKIRTACTINFYPETGSKIKNNFIKIAVFIKKQFQTASGIRVSCFFEIYCRSRSVIFLIYPCVFYPVLCFARFVSDAFYLFGFDRHLDLIFAASRSTYNVNYVIFYCARKLHKNHFITDIINIIIRPSFALCYSISHFIYGKEFILFLSLFKMIFFNREFRRVFRQATIADQISENFDFAFAHIFFTKNL